MALSRGNCDVAVFSPHASGGGSSRTSPSALQVPFYPRVRGWVDSTKRTVFVFPCGCGGGAAVMICGKDIDVDIPRASGGEAESKKC